MSEVTWMQSGERSQLALRDGVIIGQTLKGRDGRFMGALREMLPDGPRWHSHRQGLTEEDAALHVVMTDALPPEIEEVRRG